MKGETYKKLKEYEHAMEVAATCGYVRMTAAQVAGFAELYKEVFGKELTRSQRSCGHCLQKAAAAVWGEYQKYKISPHGKKIDKQNADQEQTES